MMKIMSEPRHNKEWKIQFIISVDTAKGEGCVCTPVYVYMQKSTLGALLDCFPLSSFETESLTEPRAATLEVSKAPVILLSPRYTVLGF